MSFIKEAPYMTLPISKIPLNFPTESNSLLRNYEMLKINLISPDKLHLALDIMETHFERLLESVFSKPEVESKLYESIMINESNIDLEFIHIISSLIEILLEAQSKETENIVQQKIAIQGKIANTQGNINSLKNQIEKNPEYNKINLEINGVTETISDALKEFKEEDLRKSYTTLQKRKDELEISIYMNLSMLILKKSEVSPQLVEKAIRNYSTLLDQMVNFNPKEIEEHIYHRILKNLENLNLFENQKKVLLDPSTKPVLNNKSKIHLLAIFKWINGVAKLGILNYQKERMLSNSNNQLVKKLENELQDFINEENQINLNNQSETEIEIEKVKEIIDELSLIGERSQQIVKQAQEFIKRISDNPQHKIESLLDEENLTISELYSQFQKMSIYYKGPSLINNVNTQNNQSHLICPSNLCSMLKCLKNN